MSGPSPKKLPAHGLLMQAADLCFELLLDHRSRRFQGPKAVHSPQFVPESAAFHNQTAVLQLLPEEMLSPEGFAFERQGPPVELPAPHLRLVRANGQTTFRVFD